MFLQKDFKEPSLLYFLLFEKNIATKTQVFKCVSSLLLSIPQKQYLKTVDYRGKHSKSSAFVSFSQQVFNTVQNLFKTLLLCLYLEDQEDVYICLLEALALLVDSPLFDNFSIENT